MSHRHRIRHPHLLPPAAPATANMSSVAATAPTPPDSATANAAVSSVAEGLGNMKEDKQWPWSPWGSHSEGPGSSYLKVLPHLGFKSFSDSQDTEAPFTKLDQKDVTVLSSVSPSAALRNKRQRQDESSPSESTNYSELQPKKKVLEYDSQGSEQGDSQDSSGQTIVSFTPQS